METNTDLSRQIEELRSSGKAIIKQMTKDQRTSYGTIMAYYSGAMMEIETKFKVLNEEFSINSEQNPIETIKTRLKSIESVYGKLERMGLEPTLENIENELYDVAGVRVICTHKSAIYNLADSLLQQDDVKLIERKDYIANPKESGYRSLHLIVEIPVFLFNHIKRVKAEIQLRTLAMDWWASQEHKIRYKKDLPEDVLREIDRDLKICADIGARLDDRMDDIRRLVTTAEKSQEVYLPEDDEITDFLYRNRTVSDKLNENP